MKRIALIIQKLNGGGAERTASNLSIFLQNSYDVHLIVFDGNKITYPYCGKLHDLHLPATNTLIGKIRNIYKRVIAVKKIKKENKIDYSISFMDGANIVNVLSNSGEKVVTSVRIQMSKSRHKEKSISKLVEHEIMRFIGNKSYKLVALSKGVEKDLNTEYKLPSEKLVTIYNPCDYNELLKNSINTTVELQSGNTIITMGRLTMQKGQWHLIRAITEVKKTIPDIKLYILGEGPLENKLKQLIKELELEENIILLGYVKAPHACFKFCEAFVFPSEFEGLGNVLLEAMAFGLPCIATDCFSGPREILAPDTQVKEHLTEIEMADYGILTSVCGNGEFDSTSQLTNAEKQLAMAILKILLDRNLNEHYRLKSLERCKDFSPEKITSDWMKILK